MEVLHHHTTIDGLLGILTSGAIWATDIEFLNDHEEFRVGTAALEAYSNRPLDQNDPAIRSALEMFYPVAAKMLKSNRDGRRYYVTSFTRAKDDVRQWMSYGKPNASISIAFERDALTDACTNAAKCSAGALVARLSDVSYVDRDFHNFDVLDDCYSATSLIKGLKDLQRTGQSVENFALSFTDKLLFALSATKWAAFRDEQEVRFVLSTRDIGTTPEQLCFRTAGGIAVPYIPVKIDINKIREIKIGPSIDRELAAKGLKQVKARFGLECEISFTETSLRQL